MKCGSLFAGIGGFDLATEAMGWDTAWFSEVDPYCCRVLEKRWPSVPNHGDITAVNWDDVESVDVLTGGFPCQDISVAGKGAGIAKGTRSGLWVEYARAIRHLRPRLVIVENVGALLVRGAARVFGDLAAIGYDAEWQVLSAAAMGAPHRRDRVWIVAHSEGERPKGRPLHRLGIQPQGARSVSPGSGEPSGRVTQASWPTPPSQSEDGGSRDLDGGAHHRVMLDAAVGVDERKVMNAMLNPDWVETLMGYPIGWTDIECDTPQMALGWPAGPGQGNWPTIHGQGQGTHDDGHGSEISMAVRVAEGLSDSERSKNKVWPSPIKRDATGGRTSKGRHRPDEVGLAKAAAMWTIPTQDVSSRSRPYSQGGTALQAQAVDDRGQYPWEPPRVTDRKEHRRNRLKALGNAIVSQCAYAILSGFRER